MVIPQFRSSKIAYSVSLVLGAVGFISTYFIHDQYLLFVSFLLIGCAWAAMLALPFALLTNSLSGKSLGSYMGLFNCTICLPQIIASLVGGLMLIAFGGDLVTIEIVKDKENEGEKVEVVEEQVAVEAADENTLPYEEVAEAAETTEPATTETTEPTTPEEAPAIDADLKSDVVAADDKAEVVANSADEAEAEAEVETKEVRSGQIVMLVIAGIALLLRALAVFGIGTRRKE
jgi:hypothetical protein